ncbi:MAG TPA: DUF302 domain-containing protein [Dyella sp.]|uniref:DUF302 domain-containing protein n=1 Tax=Dyella sp. TaxID=1869338 RepID=UPI002D767921|nr:DUF302 domain-containing protein [Dyella sp.]HET6555475.1 DUF302 domain-containing protein [Dyella sp.]
MAFPATEKGVVLLRAAQDVPHTIDKLKALFAEHGISVFAHIDFSSDAAQAGMSMRQEQLLLFGNPKSGTPLMQAEPLVGLDLPLKVLVWDDPAGATWMASNSADYIVQRHGLPQASASALQGALSLLNQLAL